MKIKEEEKNILFIGSVHSTEKKYINFFGGINKVFKGIAVIFKFLFFFFVFLFFFFVIFFGCRCMTVYND